MINSKKYKGFTYYETKQHYVKSDGTLTRYVYKIDGLKAEYTAPWLTNDVAVKAYINSKLNSA
ncbi:MAG: hypothetical protein M0R51_10415 [Clostridia bacterium]|jgi:hypothetical protein|nr:hypothetical protein [Clostridia bacterium]